MMQIARRRHKSPLSGWVRCVYSINLRFLLTQTVSLIFISGVQSSDSIHEHLCLESDTTKELPVFIERQTICNYETIPVHVYSIRTDPDLKGPDQMGPDQTGLEFFCLKGEYAEKFNVTKEKEIKLVQRLGLRETKLRVQIIKYLNIKGTASDKRQAMNAIEFTLVLEDCNKVSWQTILVAVLSSICVVLMSTLAIMLILYQQRGLIRSSSSDERPDERIAYAGDLRDESFINPRRTSSYEFSSLSRHSASTIERQETET